MDSFLLANPLWDLCQLQLGNLVGEYENAEPRLNLNFFQTFAEFCVEFASLFRKCFII